MKEFLAVHEGKVKGVLGCFDRVLFLGYLPLQDGWRSFSTSSTSASATSSRFSSNRRKGVAWLFRYRDVSHSANSRYLDALALVDDPSAKVREIDHITRRRRSSNGRTAKALNPLAREDLQLFHAEIGRAHV